jgi:hypothetical protein
MVRFQFHNGSICLSSVKARAEWLTMGMPNIFIRAARLNPTFDET